MTNTETRYSNIEREVLGIIHSLEKLFHYCFTHKVRKITDHKLLVVIFKRMWQPCHKITMDPPMHTPVQDKNSI